ncbi:SAF domain-containing protein [Microbacterium sp. NPDC078428]|uniref:SAF domain-containing protein n=1 Tax=Microbacterium limosum TaxID=3079935 RepID=A0AAU0ME94_9MICO|nr:SAF domain-containing protein [Microbacterium sp. Y20]WOQ68766.1 SAF domain-containing protein [Microbacterium sp. Y20]
MDAEHSVRARPRVFWSDARFFVGLGLVVLSVAGVWATIAAARTTTPVLAASRTIVAGERIAEADLRVVDVSLGVASDRYLAGGELGPGAVAARTIPRGELIATEAVTDAAASATASVVVTTSTKVPASVGAGGVVELWSAPPLEDGGFGTPAILVPDATVVRVDADQGVLASAGASTELVIPRADVAAVLAAVSSGAALSVVPSGVPG